MQQLLKPMVQASARAVLVASVVLWASGCPRGGNPNSGGNVKLNAGGATFIYPMMDKWSSEYHKAKGVEVAYASTGSGAGKAKMIDMTIDFGCSDAPLSDEDIKRAKQTHGDVIHIPLAMGAVVPAYN